MPPIKAIQQQVAAGGGVLLDSVQSCWSISLIWEKLPFFTANRTGPFSAHAFGEHVENCHW
jgi:hypothetical protein